MHDDIGMAVARLEGIAEIEGGDARAADRVHPDQPAGIYRVLADLRQQAHVVQHVHGVRRQLQPGADLAELRRLLDDVDAAVPAARAPTPW